MRKVLTYVLLLSSIRFFSQTGQGRMLIAGQVGYTAGKSDQLDSTDKAKYTNKSNALNFTLRGGYFIADDFAAGLVFGINNQQNHSETFASPPVKRVDKSTYNSTFFGLFGRYYTTPIERKLSFFGQADLTYNTGKRNSESNSIDMAGVSTNTKSYDQINGFGFIVSPGITYFLSDLVALEATFGAVGFVNQNTKYYDSNDRLIYGSRSSQIEATFNPSTLRLGISFYIGGDRGASSGGGNK